MCSSTMDRDLVQHEVAQYRGPRSCTRREQPFITQIKPLPLDPLAASRARERRRAHKGGESTGHASARPRTVQTTALSENFLPARADAGHRGGPGMPDPTVEASSAARHRQLQRTHPGTAEAIAAGGDRPRAGNVTDGGEKGGSRPVSDAGGDGSAHCGISSPGASADAGGRGGETSTADIAPNGRRRPWPYRGLGATSSPTGAGPRGGREQRGARPPHGSARGRGRRSGSRPPYEGGRGGPRGGGRGPAPV